METSLTKAPRIEAVDALRGFAVMAIVLVHNLEHFIFPVYPTSASGWLHVLDQGVFTSTFALFAGKAYAIFALLMPPSSRRATCCSYLPSSGWCYFSRGIGVTGHYL